MHQQLLNIPQAAGAAAGTFQVPVVLPQPEQEIRYFKDEWDLDRSARELIAARQCMLGANYAGCGKSATANRASALYAEENPVAEGPASIVCTPGNLLAQRWMRDAPSSVQSMTYDSHFGIRTKDGSNKFGGQPRICDELWSASAGNLMKLFKFMKRNPDILVIATGDPRQLPNPSMRWEQDMTNRAIAMMFPVKFVMTEIKRQGTESKRYQEHADAYWGAETFEEKLKITTDYFPNIDLFKAAELLRAGAYGIAYRNYTCNTLSDISFPKEGPSTGGGRQHCHLHGPEQCARCQKNRIRSRGVRPHDRGNQG